GGGVRLQGRTRSTVATRLLVLDQRDDLAAGQLRTPTEEVELDQEPQAGDHRAEALHEPTRRRRRAPGGEDVVDDENPLPRLHRVLVDLEHVGAVLEGVLLGLDVPRQLPRLADGREAGAEAVRDRRGDDEAPGLDAEHAIDRL